MKQTKARVEDALHATRAAAEEGIVPGGGVALLRVIPAVQKLLRRPRRATRSSAPRSSCGPWRSRSATSPRTPATTAASSPTRSSRARAPIGFNANTGEYVDMFKAGIVDPTKVTRSALQNAASIAGLMLTTEAMITKIKDDEEKGAPASRGRSADRSVDPGRT